MATASKVSKSDFTKIKTCTGHCRIFLHRSPQEGSLGMEVKTLLAFTYSCDLHFRFAFPWYSYSPTLKLRQLDISSDDKDWTRGKISLFMFTGEQGGGATMGKWEDGGGEDVSQNWKVCGRCREWWMWCVSLHQRVVVCLTALQSTADALGLQILTPLVRLLFPLLKISQSSVYFFNNRYSLF